MISSLFNFLKKTINKNSFYSWLILLTNIMINRKQLFIFKGFILLIKQLLRF
jgi:hypothetical protein